MKLITEIKSINNLNKYEVDGMIFSYDKFATISERTFSLPEIQKIIAYCNNKNIITILKIDKIFPENEIDDLFCFLEEIVNYNIDYYLFTDMSILFFMKNKKLQDRLIYCAKTLNCSYEDSEYYQKLGIKVVISNEISLDDIKKITLLDNIVLDGYGYSNIFYSKRKLLTLYAKYLGIKDNLSNKLLYIQEETRKQNNPIYENDNGTFIFSSYKHCFYKELEVIKNLFMFKIESLFIPENDLFEIIGIYKQALNGKINDENYQKLIAIDSNIGNTFLYQKSQILKRDDL